MGQIETEEIDAHEYNLYYVGAYKALIGKAKQDIDGNFYYWPEQNLSGSWGPETLDQIAQILKGLTQDWTLN